MGYTDSTQILKLPQFIDTDIPSWLGDVNTAMSIIDASYGAIVEDAENALTYAKQAKNTVTLVNESLTSLHDAFNITDNEVKNNTISINNINGAINDLQTSINTLLTASQVGLNPDESLTDAEGSISGNAFTIYTYGRGSFPASVKMETYGPYTSLTLFTTPGNPYDLDPRPDICSEAYTPTYLNGSCIIGSAVGVMVLKIYIYFDGENTHITAIYNGSGAEITQDEFALSACTFLTKTVPVTQVSNNCPKICPQ